MSPVSAALFAVLLDTADTGGVVAPLAIIAACAVVSSLAILLRRRRARRAGEREAAPATVAGDGDGPAGEASEDWGDDHTDLLAWQTSHGHHVDRWLDAHERTLPDLVPGADPAIDAELDRAMADAAGVCPNPEVSAMLTGMRDTAHATRVAITGGDREGATEAHSAYARHRSGAIARMNETAGRADPAAARRSDLS